MLKVGEPAPGFELPDAGMDMVTLRQFRGEKKVVLFFYPKDDTPQCTLQAIAFSDMDEDFARHNTVVLGISPDDFLAHAAFRDKHGLSAQLLSDVEGEVCRSYQVWQEREVDGVTRLSVGRVTYVIDRQGVIRHALTVGNARGHAAEVLKLVKEVD